MPHSTVVHQFLDCGIELAVVLLPDRPIVSAEIRLLTGCVNEPADKLGLNHIVEQTITKGTAQRTGQQLSDAFDALGIRWGSWAGREATGFQFTCLPEYLDQAFELHGEFLQQPIFSEESRCVAIDNSIQEIANLEDDPQELSNKLFSKQVYGSVLGRHALGQDDTLRSITGEEVIAHWKQYYQAGRLQVSLAGPMDVGRVVNLLERVFAGFGDFDLAGRERVAFSFQPTVSHCNKELEQEHVGICFPGASLDDPRQYVQRVVLGVLSGGMSARLFTEVREKQGLVYWVSAWTEHPRGIGLVFLGASTTPERCDQTYHTLIGEVDRLSRDLDEDELSRAIYGIVARTETRGDITRARCSELADDLFHHGRIIPREEKLQHIREVKLQDIEEYLAVFPRRELSVFTLGPRKLDTV